MNLVYAKVYSDTGKLTCSCPCANLDIAIMVAKSQHLACVTNDRSIQCYRDGTILSDKECEQVHNRRR